MARVTAVVNSSGAGYVAEAFHPSPLCDIEAQYSVKVSEGPMGYRTLYNQVFSL